MKLLLTLFTGLFFLIGVLLEDVVKAKKEINTFTVSLSLVVLLNLICFDIIPDVAESFSWKSLIFILLGISILKLMDLFIPDHDHNHKENHDDKKEHESHLEHIGIVTILALTIHNIIECMALYNVTSDNIKSGLLLFIGIALHNLPLGFQLGTNLKKNKILYVTILVLSGLFGGLVAFKMGVLETVFENYILSFTLGMILYLTIFELLIETSKNIKNKYTLCGIITGIIISMITNLI